MNAGRESTEILLKNKWENVCGRNRRKYVSHAGGVKGKMPSHSGKHRGPITFRRKRKFSTD